MSTANNINVTDLINGRPISRYQINVFDHVHLLP